MRGGVRSLCFLIALAFAGGCTTYEPVPRNKSYGAEVDSMMQNYYRGLARAYWDSTGGFPNLDSLYAANKAAEKKKKEAEGEH
jgi:hypothetical protein